MPCKVTPAPNLAGEYLAAGPGSLTGWLVARHEAHLVVRDLMRGLIYPVPGLPRCGCGLAGTSSRPSCVVGCASASCRLRSSLCRCVVGHPDGLGALKDLTRSCFGFSRSSMDVVKQREVRALHTDSTVTVYQAYPAAIADAAVRAGRFVSPFKRDRMTWIKPSFLWMMYRCGWATKPDQERVLAVEISREGFEWALANASLSHYDRAYHASHAEWSSDLRQRPARVQWDPERSLHLNPLPYRSLQLGIGPRAVPHYVDTWIRAITDVTATARAIRARLDEGDDEAATALLPVERPYPLSPDVAQQVGASGPS
jgi:uncharacterized protein DUF4291